MAAAQDKAKQRAARQRDLIAGYPAAMEQIFFAWKTPAPEDSRGWMIYASSYLFNTQDVRWAIDPVRLEHRLPNAPSFDFSLHFCDLDFILLTHQHKDHFDLELIDQIKYLPRKWVIPEFLLPRIEELSGFPWERVVVPKPMMPFSLDGITITAFDGLHWEKVYTAESKYPAGVFRGVPSAGYLVELTGKRWLFPGDTRSFEISRMPDFGPVDLLFAHLWLGRGEANNEEPQLLDKYCQFMLGLKPNRMLIAHLEDFDRPPEEYWDLSHANLVRAWFHQHAPAVEVFSARIGEGFSF